MAKKPNRIQKRVCVVLQRMIDLAVEDPSVAPHFAELLQNGLDNLAEDDVFGTEGQSDPRGDMRDGEYAMDHVQGVDAK